MSRPELLYIDLFCGAGGTSTGVNSATINGQRCADVIACVNHDPNAIASHAANHPDAMHFEEDIRTLDLTPLIEHIKIQKEKNPSAYIVLWASLECTNFSKAKGGLPRDADSRTLAEHLFRYIEGINPDYIQIENVEEFMSWGDLDQFGKPISKDKGKCYLRWINKVKRYGYHFEKRILNAADFGAYTSRRRFFGIFAKRNLPIAFPEQTHCKNGSVGLFGDLKPWKPVREVLDFEDTGKSILLRDKPLAEKTLERIYAGLIKFVAGGKDKFLIKYNSMNQAGKYKAPSVDDPYPVVAAQNRLAVAQVSFLSKQYGGHPESKNCTTDGPAGTITCIDHHAFVSAFYGNGYNSSTEEPAPTLTTKDKLAIVASHFIANEYSGGGQISSIEQPNPAVLTNPKQKLVTIMPWIMDTNFGNVGSSIDDPSRVITANRKYHYLMNPLSVSEDSTIDEPLLDIDCDMPYLIASKKGKIAIQIYEDDSPMMIKIKEFMALYGIIDIKMRMLKISELKLIMGFPADYTLIGTQAEQKKYIGNAVECHMAAALCVATAMALRNMKKNNQI